jgi:hypothetical protein
LPQQVQHHGASDWASSPIANPLGPMITSNNSPVND